MGIRVIVDNIADCIKFFEIKQYLDDNYVNYKTRVCFFK
jgi:hypothetical protein